MADKPLYLLLCSRDHEKVQLAAMVASVAAVSERPVHVFVSMGAIQVFERGLSAERRYQGGEFSKTMRERNVPDAIDLLSQGKALGDMTIHACSMALDVEQWDMDNLVEDLFDGAQGLTKFLSDTESGELITL